MVDYEIDLSVLEDMCSDLEEDVILIDKNLNIVWMNTVLKKRIDNHARKVFDVRNYSFNSLDSVGIENLGVENSVIKPEIKKIFAGMYGDDFNSDSPLIKVFATGKLSKSISLIENLKIKKTLIPIKFENDVAYVLEIVEEHNEKHDKIKPIVGAMNSTNSINSTEYMESTGTTETNASNKYISILKSLMNSFKKPAFVIDTNNYLIATNSYFDSTFKQTDALGKYVIEKIQERSQESLLEIKKFIRMRYSMSRREMHLGKIVVGYIYFFNLAGRAKSKKVKVKKIKKLKTLRMKKLRKNYANYNTTTSNNIKKKK